MFFTVVQSGSGSLLLQISVSNNPYVATSIKSWITSIPQFFESRRYWG
ncbi:hypothetical protein BH23BAC1_BH23BAC1_42190 [soil metagenome]